MGYIGATLDVAVARPPWGCGGTGGSILCLQWDDAGAAFAGVMGQTGAMMRLHWEGAVVGLHQCCEEATLEL